MTIAESPIPEPGQLTYNEALGMTFQQYLFRFRIQQRDVAAMLGTSQSVISRKLRGTVGWTAEDLYEMAAMLGVSMDRLTPTRSIDGSWVPAPYVPGQQKTPALASAGVSVAGEGLEPSTSRFEVAANWLRLALERAEMELYWAAWRIRKFLAVRIVTARQTVLPHALVHSLAPAALFFASNTGNGANGGNATNTGNGIPSTAGTSLYLKGTHSAETAGSRENDGFPNRLSPIA